MTPRAPATDGPDGARTRPTIDELLTALLVDDARVVVDAITGDVIQADGAGPDGSPEPPEISS